MGCMGQNCSAKGVRVMGHKGPTTFCFLPSSKIRVEAPDRLQPMDSGGKKEIH